MAQLKSTSVTGNLSVTGNVVASQIIKLDGTNKHLLAADGSVYDLDNFTSGIKFSGDGVTVGGHKYSIYADKYIRAPWLQHSSANLNSADYDKICITDKDGWIYYRTKREFITDLNLSYVYNYKGEIANIDALKAITSAEVGDVYFLSATYHSWACKQKVTAATGDKYETYWSNLGKNVDLSGYMTLDTNQTISGVKTFTAQPVISTSNGLKFTNGNCTLKIYNTSASPTDYAAIEVRSNSSSTNRNLFIDLANNSLVIGAASGTADTTYKVNVKGTLNATGLYENGIQTIIKDTGICTTNYIPKFTDTNKLQNSTITDDGSIIILGSKVKAEKTIYIVQGEFDSLDNSQDCPGGIQLGRNGLINATNNEGNEFKTVLGININEPTSNSDNILYLGNDAFETKVRGNTNILNGKLWLTSNAHFEYNTDDKCIDVLFT